MRTKLSVFIPIALALCGCTDLEAVRSISTKLTTATKGWNDVSAEIQFSSSAIEVTSVGHHT